MDLSIGRFPAVAAGRAGVRYFGTMLPSSTDFCRDTYTAIRGPSSHRAAQECLVLAGRRRRY